jgi:hypothetical protein
VNEHTQLRDHIRNHYAQAATAVTAGKANLLVTEKSTNPCCTPQTAEEAATSHTSENQCFGKTLYPTPVLNQVPTEAVAGSLGCGNPVAIAELHEGERVLDLGSGGGIDVLLSAKRVGPTGFVYGIDLTDEMLELANANKNTAGVTNVEFRKGIIEDLPLLDQAVDVVISNCVVNLSTDKPTVLSEIFRVLTPGGRIGISDVVAEDRLTHEQRAKQGSYVGCIAGALSKTEYLEGLTTAGFHHTSVEFTHQVADGMHGAIIRAIKPKL